MPDKIDTIISQSLNINIDNLQNHLLDIITNIQKSLSINEDAISLTSQLDQKNNNGFIIDQSVIKNIFKNISEEQLHIGDIVLSQRDTQSKLIYGKQITPYGNVLVITNGNPYLTLEMSLRNILAGNKTIFINNGYMYSTNKFIIELIQTILEQYNISKYLVQIFITEDYSSIYKNYANIDLIICLGDHSLQQQILKESRVKVITSGYDNYDIYIEDPTHLSFINKIINTGLPLKIYTTPNISLDIDTIPVTDVEEAIAKINYNSSHYSSSIFTSNSENATKFIKEIKSSIVTINTSPTIERLIDIKQIDLIKEKTIIYPDNFKYQNQIIINKDNN